jgi:hypothetical protein
MVKVSVFIKKFLVKENNGKECILEWKEFRNKEKARCEYQFLEKDTHYSDKIFPDWEQAERYMFFVKKDSSVSDHFIFFLAKDIDKETIYFYDKKEDAIKIAPDIDCVFY